MIYGRHSVGSMDLTLRSFPARPESAIGFASAKPQDDTRRDSDFWVGLWSAV